MARITLNRDPYFTQIEQARRIFQRPIGTNAVYVGNQVASCAPFSSLQIDFYDILSLEKYKDKEWKKKFS